MYKSEAHNEDGFYAKVVADSNCDGTRITTLELKYPRFIHAEFMTHRMFSRNASSSRAIPVEKMLNECTAQPIHWGKNQAGMQADAALSPADESVAIQIWEAAREHAIHHSRELLSLETHKQVANRITEPFQFIKVIVTATEWQNFFDLRLHKDAQPEIMELANLMMTAMNESDETWLEYDDWHLPYITQKDIRLGLDVRDARMVSAGRCARVSYMNHDNSEPDIRRDRNLANVLLFSKHLSPFEHQARPMNIMNDVSLGFEVGTTHLDRNGYVWSGNFRNWIQHRQFYEQTFEDYYER